MCAKKPLRSINSYYYHPSHWQRCSGSAGSKEPNQQKQLPSFEIWLTFDDISVPTFQGVAVLAMLSLTHFGRSKPVRADQLGWNLASIGKEEGKNEPASLFELDFILNLSESMGKAQLTFSKIRSVACNMLTCWHPAVKNEAQASSLAATTGQAKKVSTCT